MKKRNQPGHCGDEVLLSCADGELPPEEEVAIVAHLKACWECRARLQELETTAQAVARLAQESTFGDPQHSRDSLAAFHAWRREFERNLEEVQRGTGFSLRRKTPDFSSWWQFLAGGLQLSGRGLATAVLLPLVALAGFGGWYFSVHHAIEASDVELSARNALVRRYPTPPADALLPHSVPAEEAEPVPPPQRAAPLLLDPIPDTQEVLIEVMYALHRIHACGLDYTEASAEPDGHVLVRGIVRSPERKAEVMAALRELDLFPRLRVEVLTAAEAVEDTGPGKELLVHEAARTGADTEPLHFREQLEQYFARQAEADPSRKVIDFANEIVDASDRVLTEAWALRRLAQQSVDGLPKHSLWLLETMVRDHLRQLSEQSAAMRMVLAGPLHGLSGAVPLTMPSGGLKAGEEWNSWSAGAVERAQAIRFYTTGLFAGSGLPPAVAGAETPMLPKTALASLMAALEALEEDARWAEEEIGEHPSRLSRWKTGSTKDQRGEGVNE